MTADPRHRPWIVRDRRRVFSGGPIEEVAVEQVTLPDGRDVADYYAIRLPDYALVFAVTGDEHVVLMRQYKHGPRRVCLAFPGGALDRGEDPLAAARRELREETGLVSERWTALGGFVTNANQYCNTAHLFVAEACRRVAEPSAPDMERPELVLVPRATLWTAVAPEDFGLASHVALLALATHPAARPPGGRAV